MDKEEDIFNKIKSDEFYSQFLDGNLKTDLLKSLTITEQVKKLGEGIELVTKELQKQVVDKHNDLITQACNVNRLENILSSLNLHVQNVLADAERIKVQVVGPYQSLEKQTVVLGRLHLASHILRQVSRIQHLSKRLDAVNDPVQKAVILQELELLASDEDLKNIDVVTSEMRNIRAQQQKVVRLATSSLTQGIMNENKTQANTALQIFLNLGTVKKIAHDTTTSSLNECRESLKVTITGAGTTAINKNKVQSRTVVTTSQGFKNRMWTDLEKTFFEEIYQQAKQIKFLQSIMNDIDVNMNEIASNFWRELGEIVKEEFNNSPAAVQQMLEVDYPKLLKIYAETCQKIDYEDYKFDRSILEKWENLYLSSSLTNLLDPINEMFNQETPAPTHDQIDSLIRNITNELSMALVEERLSEKIAKNVSKCIRMFAVKTEQKLVNGAEAAQVIAGTSNSGQQINIQLANALYYLQTQVQRMLTNMKESISSACSEIVLESLEGLNILTVAILQPLIVSINSAIETIIVTIHLEQDWSKLQIQANRTNISCSPYMRELSQFINRVYNTYLTPFENKEILAEQCKEIVIRCIELIVRHASLLRPLNQGGRIRLQTDFQHLENCLKVLCPFIADLGTPYRVLKSMATLITLSPEEIIEKQKSGSCVPHSTVLLMLFSFAGPELASPHQNAAWSLSKLSAWLDEHTSEADRLDLIAGAVQRYETIIRQNKAVNYDPIYPLMSEFLEYAVKESK